VLVTDAINDVSSYATVGLFVSLSAATEILGSRPKAEEPTGEWSGRLEGPCAGLVGKGCLSSNRRWEDTVHHRLHALLRRGVFQADALARLAHEHRGQPRRNPGVHEDALPAWLNIAL
jgi:hypothetical protein